MLNTTYINDSRLLGGFSNNTLILLDKEYLFSLMNLR